MSHMCSKYNYFINELRKQRGIIMTSRLSNQHLSKKIHQLTQHLPKKEELSGQRQGSSYYRKIAPETFLASFKKTQNKLENLANDYQLTTEQKDFIQDAQLRLVQEVQRAFDQSEEHFNELDQFLDKHS